jgi:phospholipid transport system substrate-binding protein
MLLICSVSFVEAGATPADPSHVVESLHAVLIEAMQKSDTLNYQARVDLIWPIAATSIDQKFMAEKSIGRYWKKMSESEKNTWQKTFTNLTVANYAGRFTGYTGEIFETKSVEDAPRETKLVNTVLILPDDEDVVLNYRMRMTDSGWKIIDIYMNGTVSELSLRRSEYSTTLKRSGFEALVEALEEKIVTLSESNSVQIALPAPDGSPASP